MIVNLTNAVVLVNYKMVLTESISFCFKNGNAVDSAQLWLTKLNSLAAEIPDASGGIAVAMAPIRLPASCKIQSVDN